VRLDLARVVTPRYELQLVRRGNAVPPILIWGRHRVRFLAGQALRSARRHVDSDAAHFVVHDRWTGRVVLGDDDEPVRPAE
jgi:hypothetical protein